MHTVLLRKAFVSEIKHLSLARTNFKIHNKSYISCIQVDSTENKLYWFYTIITDSLVSGDNMGRIRLFNLRMLDNKSFFRTEVAVSNSEAHPEYDFAQSTMIRCHHKRITALSWYPIDNGLFVSTSTDCFLNVIHCFQFDELDLGYCNVRHHFKLQIQSSDFRCANAIRRFFHAQTHRCLQLLAWRVARWLVLRKSNANNPPKPGRRSVLLLESTEWIRTHGWWFAGIRTLLRRSEIGPKQRAGRCRKLSTKQPCSDFWNAHSIDAVHSEWKHAYLHEFRGKSNQIVPREYLWCDRHAHRGSFALGECDPEALRGWRRGRILSLFPGSDELCSEMHRLVQWEDCQFAAWACRCSSLL